MAGKKVFNKAQKVALVKFYNREVMQKLSLVPDLKCDETVGQFGVAYSNHFVVSSKLGDCRFRFEVAKSSAWLFCRVGINRGEIDSSDLYNFGIQFGKIPGLSYKCNVFFTPDEDMESIKRVIGMFIGALQSIDAKQWQPLEEAA